MENDQLLRLYVHVHLGSNQEKTEMSEVQKINERVLHRRASETVVKVD